MPSLALPRQPNPEIFIPGEDATLARQLQRRASAGEVKRIALGVYVLAESDEEISLKVRRHWQMIAGHLVPGAVVSHISAFTGGLMEDGYVTLSHPKRFNRTIHLPGVDLVLLKGEIYQPGDLPLGNTGLYWASQSRSILENLGRVSIERPTRAGKDLVEERLVSIMNASGEDALNRVRDGARAIASAIGLEKAFNEINSTIGLLLNTHKQGRLRTRQGQLVAQGTPVDSERMMRFELLAAALRTAALPMIADVAPSGVAKMNFAFIESYFSNFVEGTKFSIEEAEGIVLRNAMVPGRPKDSHDILGVFHHAIRPGFRDSVPPPEVAFVEGLQDRHKMMLERRPEVNPGHFKTETNFAGMTQFVLPAFVRGTLQEGSKIALSVPEGLARAIYYAFLISETHPFDDGNGRLSRLIMNSELSRLGLCRVIIPTLFHPQYVDCQRTLTRSNEPEPFIKALTRSAKWCAGFDYSNLSRLIVDLKETNAFEESPEWHILRDSHSKATDEAALKRAKKALGTLEKIKGRPKPGESR